MSTEIHFYLAIYIEKCIIRFNICVSPVRTQMTNTQKMNNDEISTQNIPNLHVCYLEKVKSKRINAENSESHDCYMDKNKYKRLIANACSLDKSE